MTLREFVSDTLLQIVDGVADAKIKNQRVAPRVIQAAGLDAPIVVADAENPRAFVVDFDVAVAVSKTTDAEAKGAVSVYVFEVGGQRVSSTEQSTVSRIKFGVPIVYDHVA